MNYGIKIGAFCFLFFSCQAKKYEVQGIADKKYTTPRQKKKLFKAVGCQYCNNMEINVADFEKIEPTKTEHYEMLKHIIHELSNKYEELVEEYALAPMYLKWISPNIGYGVFAAYDIPKDDFIGVYTGELRPIRDAHAEDVDYAWYYPINTSTGQRILIDGKFKGNELRFINHDKNPNTKCIDVLVNGKFYMCYIATKKIPKNTQLTISYGDGYWDSRKINPEIIT